MINAEPPQQHDAVLLKEAVAALVTRTDGIYIDGTFGRGGHSQIILSKLNAQGRLIAFDKDAEAITYSQTITDPRFLIVHDSFANLQTVLVNQGITQVAGILFDLGVSSPQLDNAQRGFSFRQDGPLDMRMNTTKGLTAAQWLAVADEQEITKVIREYGEERFAAAIAKAIIARRQETTTRGPLTRSAELAQIITQTVKTREAGQNPATRTFQAIRIFINQELEDLSQGLAAALEMLAPGGRLVVISFHSLEDRIVKNFMRSHTGWTDSQTQLLRRRLPLRETEFAQPRLKLLGRVRAQTEEVTHNRRARSAIMRIAEKIS